MLTLRNVVNVEILQEIQTRFSDATGLGVIIADQHGIPVTKPTNFTSFCSQMRSSEEGLQCCVLSDRKVGLMAAEQAKPIVHYCHSGLVDVAAPIILNGKYLGSILCGQVLVENSDENHVDEIREKTKHLPIDQELLRLYFEKIEFTSDKRIEAATEMLQLVANYIIKTGANYLAQEELNEKNQKLMEEMETRSTLENLLQEAQLKVLQSQINPHFLFNTLNTISRLAYLENAEQTQNVTYSLAKIMRYSLRNIDQLVTLREELDYMKNYINIQQSRFRNRIKYEEIVEVDAKALKMPILSIQPIIENAIIHGFEPQNSTVVIKIHIFLKNDNVVLEISDTGVGMTKEAISSIFSHSSVKKSSHTTGIGMNNVQKRIQHYFGEEYGITAIKSQPGIGTTVRMVIPKSGGVLS
ncbi:PocR ligand-binding domain-containing protein [Fictibacillus sp. WQ 8-8]|uniref:sensor histidine kinase n=1 Tax=Fictibacillus sp. WQ 8-8 TaxID=2938788 RepID=UPI00210A8809|nr:PocR ligand-binding domain-containing protein [Fictibacillus sp. WQ 8-8]MCQ6268827.1 PocR ligand-binding domain-containing protein [Fictibacillus sp. WQ 8-8]